MRDNGYACKCFWCNKEYFVRVDAYERQMSKYGHVCCKTCFGNEPSFKAARKRVMLSNNPFKGKTHTEETKALLSQLRIGVPSWNRGLTKETSDAVKRGGINTSITKRSMDLTNDKNPNWCGGSSVFNKDNDFFTKWLPFRESILERDCYSCWKCGCKQKSKLEIHHLLSKSRFPEYKYSEENCIVLCKPCHKEFHKKYGLMKFTPGDTINWINKSRSDNEKLVMC